MKALVLHAAEDLRIETQEIADPAPDEVQVQIDAGGICGSDLHYFNHGGFGAIRLQQPMILGHEVAGTVVATGAEVSTICLGQLVSVSPSRPCLGCEYCSAGYLNHCLNMRFYGSAMPMPHIQGAFRQRLNALASQCVIADGLTAGEAALAEPFAVVLHATRRVGDLLGKRVLVTGCGPIGVLSIVAARRAGALEIVSTDLSRDALHFDVHYECSGAAPALATGIACLRPRGVLLQLGLGGDMSVPMMQLTAKEIDVRGSFRFHEEFALAVELMQRGLVDLKPLITHSMPIDDAVAAFKLAADRTQSMKVQLDFA